jgi:hypothetical protein
LSTLDVLHKIVLNFPLQQWNRVAKLSMAHTDGIPIEYTSSTHSSLAMCWAISHFSNEPNNPDKYSELLHDFENHITSRISEFAQKLNLHIVHMQPGALRSKPGTVPQIAHQDFRMNTYKEKFPNQLFIGFMPVTPDGMFLQVWNGPGAAKLVLSHSVNFCSFQETPFMPAGCAPVFPITITDFISIFLFQKNQITTSNVTKIFFSKT